MPDPVRPSPTELAELAHRSTVDAVGPSLIHLRLDDGAASLELGVGPLPADRHPADALVGFRAPDAWDAVGIATTGVVHDLPPMACAGRGRFTTLAFRDRTSATVIERDDGRVDVLEGAPVGWVVDVLRRVLGLPADPPEGSTAVLVDTWWLDTLVSGGYATEHDALIARKLAVVLCGGPSGHAHDVTEQEMLELEAETFVSLCGEPKSLERMQHMLLNNKPLRN